MADSDELKQKRKTLAHVIVQGVGSLQTWLDPQVQIILLGSSLCFYLLQLFDFFFPDRFFPEMVPKGQLTIPNFHGSPSQKKRKQLFDGAVRVLGRMPISPA